MGLQDRNISHLIITFFADSRLNVDETRKAGAPKYDDIVLCRIQHAGDPKQTLVVPAHQPSQVMRDGVDFSSELTSGDATRYTYAELYPDQFKAFEANRSQTTGTPLPVLTLLTPAKIKELEARNVRTVEALAGLDGEKLSKLGAQCRDFKDAAVAYLKRTQASSEFQSMRDENQKISDELTGLREAMAELKAGKSKKSSSKENKHAQNPFKDWAKNDVINWMEEAGHDKVDRRASEDRVREMAMKFNQELAEEAKAA